LNVATKAWTPGIDYIKHAGNGGLILVEMPVSRATVEDLPSVIDSAIAVGALPMKGSGLNTA
jgi:hypothetical protein